MSWAGFVARRMVWISSVGRVEAILSVWLVVWVSGIGIRNNHFMMFKGSIMNT